MWAAATPLAPSGHRWPLELPAPSVRRWPLELPGQSPPEAIRAKNVDLHCILGFALGVLSRGRRFRTSGRLGRHSQLADVTCIQAAPRSRPQPAPWSWESVVEHLYDCAHDDDGDSGPASGRGGRDRGQDRLRGRRAQCRARAAGRAGSRPDRVRAVARLRHQVRRALAVLEGRAVTGAGPPDHRGRPPPQ